MSKNTSSIITVGLFRFQGGTIKKATVNVSGEHVLDLEMEALGMIVRE